jgi:hypothetical protein
MRGLAVALALAAALAAACASAGTERAGAEPAASRVVDRTLLCATRQNGGIHEIEAESFSGVRQSGKWLRMPFAVVSTGETASNAMVLENSLAWITSGRPDRDSQLGDYFFPVRALDYGTLAINRRICHATKRVPLGSAGLRGGGAGQLGDSYDCQVPKRVVVRVRAVLESPGTLKPHGAFLLTSAAVTEAKVVVRTQSGRPLAFASTVKSGRSTIFTGKGCFPE